MNDYANISYVNEAIERLVREVIREKREDLESEIKAKFYQIHKLLDGGLDILKSASGENLRRLYEQRRVLWNKADELLNVLALMNKVL